MTNIEQITQFFNDNSLFHGNIRLNERLASHTTMHVGGNAGIFIEPTSLQGLIYAINVLKNSKTDFFILGGGSNVVISDAGLDAVISTRKMNDIKEVCGEPSAMGSSETRFVRIDCGCSWGSVLAFCKNNDISAFEGFSGLSGTCGGALFMNATCFGHSACDNLISLDYLDLTDMKIHVYEKKEGDWGYKRSPFQTGQKIIISAVFSVARGFDSAFSEKCFSDRKEKGHFKSPSAGSVFKNDTLHNVIAGKLIDECGLKGFSVGGAQIAPWHGNFIINPEQKAKASDIKKLVEHVQSVVMEEKKVMLEKEIIFVGI